MRFTLITILLMIALPLVASGEGTPKLPPQLDGAQPSRTPITQPAGATETVTTKPEIAQRDQPAPAEGEDTAAPAEEEEGAAEPAEEEPPEPALPRPPIPARPAAPASPAAPPMPPAVTGGPLEEGVEEEPFFEDILETTPPEEGTAGPKKITIDTIVYVDYQFFGSPDAFKVKYHINMGGNANISTALINGNAEIATEVTGYLAKWPQGQCMLDVSIASVPYEVSYRQTAAEEADLNVKFKKEITEKWESTCTFIGGVTRPFKTQGPPEKWIEEALKKASPPLSAIAAPIEANEASSITFDIPEYTVIEENLGSAKVKGTGIVTIQPATKATPEKKEGA